LLSLLAWMVGSAATRLTPRRRTAILAVSLYTVALVQAGAGIFTLQSTGSIETTPLRWLRTEFAFPGLYPTAEAVGVQLVILIAAAWSGIRVARTRGRKHVEVAEGPNFLHAIPADRTAVSKMGSGRG
jgi:high-affinity Fe2+/Pb2+ permease